MGFIILTTDKNKTIPHTVYTIHAYTVYYTQQ